MIWMPGLDQIVRHRLRRRGGHREDADDYVLLFDHLAEPVGGPDGQAADLLPDLLRSTSKIATTLKPWSAKMSELAIAWPRWPAPKRAMLCWPDVRRILLICETSESTL